VEKGLGHVVRRQEMEYETNKNVSNVGDYKSVEGVKSPGQKRSREEVLKQLNQELKAEKQQERKLSAKNIPASAVQRENTQLKRNNYVEGEEDMKGFESKPKLRRTPPKE
jgi:activator of HSP90 ATPase